MKTSALSVGIPTLVLSACCVSSRAFAFTRGQARALTATLPSTRISHSAAPDYLQVYRTPPSPHEPTATTTILHAKKTNAALDSSIPTTIERYDYDGWDLTYRYRPAAPGQEDDEPLILIHPVGIGCSSWIWTKMMGDRNNGEQNM